MSVLAIVGMFGALATPAAQADDGTRSPGAKSDLVARLTRAGLGSGKAHAMLTELCTGVGHRLSGSKGAELGVAWAKKTMEACGLENVRLEPVMVPRWVRGPVETAIVTGERLGPVGHPLRICALGGSVGTPPAGVAAGVIEVRSFDELKAAGDRARGKIVFFNRPFDDTQFETFHAYSGAVDQRGSGAVEAARAGGVAAIVRSMTSRRDDVPHTGSMHYAGGVPQVPAAAVSLIGAEWLSAALKNDPDLKLKLTLSCKTMPDVESANVVGEIVGSEKPSEVVVIGGHLDSWDKGQGAHDDGAGCVHAIEALRLLKELGLKPRRTIRAVMFMNEENGARGGEAYAKAERPGETHIAAIESDEGGFSPRGFGIGGGGGDAVYDAVARWAPLFTPIEADRFHKGGGGVDIGPLGGKGVPTLGLRVNIQRYFDFHHSDKDVIDAVNPRELELGAITMAAMAYLIADEGLPVKPADASSR
jgi:Zn-dependent M28 family amino/carboxypeptidase